MNRSQLLKIIDESDNMSLMDDEYAFPGILQKIIDNNEQTKFAEHIKDYSKIKAFAEEFNGISFLKNETISGDEIAVYIGFGGIHYCKEEEFAAIYIGHVINDCGFIEFLFMTEDSRFLRSLNERLFIKNDDIIAYNTEELIEYLLTKEYDYHIPITEETYEKLCEAGWYEGRRVDISQIIKATQEHNVILTQEQRRFLEEFAGLKSPDPDSKHGFYVLDKYNKKIHVYENPRDDEYFGDLDRNSDEYKRVTVRIGSCCRTMMYLELSPDGLLLCDGSAVGRTVMEGWQILLVGRKRQQNNFIVDYYNDLNEDSEVTCYQEFASSDIDDIKNLLTIIGKQFYAVENEDGSGEYEIVIE